MMGQNSSLLSLIDVISCGLGAAVLLFLLYAALPHMEAEDPTGARQHQGSSPSAKLPAGSVVEQAGRGNTVALRIVELQRVKPNLVPAAAWRGGELELCQQYRMVTRDGLAFALSCPNGLSPDARLEFELPMALGRGKLRAIAVDGAQSYPLAPEWIECEGASTTVQFQLGKSEPIRACGRAI